MTETHPTSPRGIPPARSWGRRLVASAAGLVLLAGFGAASAQVDVTPLERDFGAVEVGETAILNVTLTNNSGLGDRTISALIFSGDPAFSRALAPDQGTCGTPPFELADLGGSCTVGVSFAPSAAANAVGTLVVEGDLDGTPNEQLGVVDLIGSGIDVPSAPQNVSAIGGNASAAVNWTAPASDGNSAITGYTVTSLPEGLTCTPAPATNTSCTVTGLTNGEQYTFTAIATNAIGDSLDSAPSNAVTPAAPLPNPVIVSPASLDLTPTVGDEASANVIFTNPGPGTITFDAEETYNPPTPGLVHGGGTSCRGATLGSGQSCNFEVLWNADTFRVEETNIELGAAGYTPAIISVRALYNGVSATLSNPGANSQQVTLTNTSGGSVSLTGLSLASDGDFAILPSSTCEPTSTLAASATCVVDIQFTQQAVGPASATLSFTSDALPGEAANIALSATGVPLAPSEPLDVSATAGNASALVEWDAPSDDGGSPVTGYTVTSSPASAGCSTAGLSCTVSGLTNGTPYTFTVTASNIAGTSDPSAPSPEVTPAGAPDAPVAPTGTAGNGQVVLNWVAPNANGSPITGYAVEQSTDGIDWFAAGGTCASPAASPCTATGLTNGTAYQFRIAAINSVGTGDFSAASAPATPAGPPSAPTISSVTALNNNAIQIDWSYGAANGATVTGALVTASPGGATCTDAGTSCTISGLSNGQSYTFTAVTEASDQDDSAASAASAAIRASLRLPPLFTQSGLNLGSSGPSLGGLAASSCGGGSTTKFVVPYVVRLDNVGNYFFETRDITFDTVLLVYNEGGTVVACNDDFGGTLRSGVTVNNATPGALYTVYATHFGAARTGSFTLCMGEAGTEGGCGVLPDFNTEAYILSTTASLDSGARARTNETFTVEFELLTDGLIDRIEDGMRIEAQQADGTVVASCVGDVASPEEPLRAGEKALKAPAAPKGTPLSNSATGSCELSGLKPSNNIVRLVAVFDQNGQFLESESAPFGFTVTRSNTTTQLNNNGPTAYGADIVLSALFNATAPGANPVTGTARFVRQPGNVTIVEVPIVPGIEGAASTATTTITTNPDVALSPITYNVVILDNTDFIGSNNNTVHTVNRSSTALTIDSITPAVGPDYEVNETVTVTASVASMLPGEGTPNGTVQVRGTGGDAAATTGCDITLSGGTGSCDLSFSTKGGATLVFSYVEAANFAASSNSQAVTVLGLPVVMTLTTPVGTTYFGNAYDVAYSLSGGAGNFEGAVTLSATGPSAANASCVSDSAPANNTGVCTLAGGQNIGAYTLDGAYAGDTQDLAAIDGDSLSIVQATTELSVSTTPSSSAAGENVSISVNLSLTNGTGLLDGTIEITAAGLTDSGVASVGCTVPVVGQASPFTADCTRAFTLFGNDQLVTAVFTPSSGNFAGDTGTTEHDVTSASTQTTILGFSPANPQVGDAVAVNFDVNGGEGTYQGEINVTVGGAPVVCDPLNFETTTGVGSCRVEALFQTADDYSFVVAFDGTELGNDADSTSDASVVTVDPRSTTLTLSAAPAAEQQAGQNVVFTLNAAAITDLNLDGFDAGNVASGTAYVCLSSSPVCDSGSALCTATLSGAGTDGAATGTCPSSFAAVGNYSFVANYVGNTNFAGSSSALLEYAVQPRDTSISITQVSSFTSGASPAASALVGERVTVSFDVNGGLGEYEGSVTVSADGPGAFAATCIGGGFDIETGLGSCTFSVGAGNGLEQAGSWSFSADFIPSLEGNDSSSTTGLAAASISIVQANTGLVLSSTPAPSVFGEAFTLIATVTAVAPAEGYPTGDVNFFDGESNAIGVVTLTPTATAGVSTASITGLTRDVALPNGWRFVAATITNPNFAGANDFGYDHLVNRDNQTVNVTAPTSIEFAPAGSFNVSALATANFTMASSGQAVSLSAGPSGVCSGSGSSSGGSNVAITIEGGGTCVITASVPQSNNYNAVAPQTVNVEITPIDQTISFAALPNRPAAAGTFELAATAPAGAVSFASTTTDICTVSGITVSYVAAGTCSITASQAGNASYNAAPDVVQSFAYVAVTVGPETLGDGTRNQAYTAQFTASGTGATLPFTFAVTAGVLPDGLTLAANGDLTGTPLDAGSYAFTVTATDSSTVPNLGTPYSGSRDYTLEIAKNPQDITGFAVAPTTLVYLGPAGTLSATGGGSGNTVVFSSLTTDFCTVIGDQVTPVAAGLCTVAANQAGNDDYEDAPQVTLDTFVAKAEQDELMAAAATNPVAYLQTSLLSVTGGTTGGDVTYEVTAGETFCSITGSTLTATLAGDSCTVTATMAGDDNYLPVSDTVVVNTIKAEQVDFVVAADPSTIQYTATSALSTTGGNGDGTVNYEITSQSSAGVCSLLNSTITGAGIGSCTITATKAADANYEEAVDTVVITVVEADQTVTFGNNPGPLTIGGATGNVVATATSGLAVTYGVDAGSVAVCEVDPSNGGITMLTAGDCVITADQAGDDFYNPAAQVTQTVVIDKEQPSISLVGSGSPTSPGNAVTFTATVAGGFSPTGTVTFQNDGADIAGCVNVALTGLTAECVTSALPQGSHPITANYNGDVNNLTATSNTVTQVVLTGTTIVLSPSNIIEARFGQAVNVGYTVSGGVAPNGGDVTVTATRPGSTVTCTAAASAGACTLTSLVTTGPALLDGYTVSAAYAGDSDDGASSTAASQTLNVLRSNTNTALTIAPVTSSPFGQSFILTATVTAVAPGAGVPPGTIVFLRDGESIGEVALNGSGVASLTVPAGLAVGNYVFRAEYAQTTNYLQSFENRSYAVTAKATTTTITSSSVNPSALGAAVSFNYTVTTSPADTTPTGTVTLTASTGETCAGTVAAGTCSISFATAGARTLTAVYGADVQHAGSTSASFAHTVNQGSTTAALTIDPASPAQIGQQVSFNVAVTGTPESPLPTGTVNVVHGVAPGTPICSFVLPATGCAVTFTAEQSFSDVRAVYAGDTNFTGATSNSVASYVVEKVATSIVFVTADSTITFGDSIAIATSVTGGINGNLGLTTVTASAAGKTPVTCSAVASAGSCSLVGLEAATWTLAATYAGDADDQASSTVLGITVTVNKATQSITFGANPGPLTFGGTSGSVSATASSGLAVSYSTASTACSVDAASGLITIIGAGDCVVAANQAGNDNYEAAPEVTQTVVINKAEQSITFGANPGPLTFGGTSGSVSATASSGLAVSYSTASTACSVDATSGAITIISAGDCVVAANQAGNDNYLAAPEATQTVVINKLAQTITFGANPGPFTFGGTAGSVSATASSGLAVSYSTASTTVCSVDAASGLITIIGAGDCVVAADQAGNGDFEAAPQVTQTVVINKAAQTITFGANPGPFTFGGTAGSVSATASSGLAVSYSTASTTVCSVDATSGAITIIGAGNCVVAANQAGNGNYLAAPEVTQTVVINPGNQAALVVTATPNPVIAGQTSALSTTGGSGTGAVTYAVTTGGAFCTVADSTLTAVAAGDCTVTATKAADANYLVQTGLVVVTVNPATVDLSIVKTGRYTLSGITWELLVSNTGPGAATAATVVDALPTEVSGASWACVTQSGGGSCVSASGTGDVDVDVNLPANSSVLITITATVVGTPATIVNTAEVITPDGITDTNPANNTSTLNLPVALFSDGFEGNGLVGVELKSGGGLVELDGAKLETVLDGYKAVNAVRYSADGTDLQLQVREVAGLVQVRLLQASAEQGLSATRWMELWPGDAVRLDYSKSGTELQTRLSVGPQQQ